MRYKMKNQESLDILYHLYRIRSPNKRRIINFILERIGPRAFRPGEVHKPLDDMERSDVYKHLTALNELGVLDKEVEEIGVMSVKVSYRFNLTNVLNRVRYMEEELRGLRVYLERVG